jgi:hypothetical protein
MAYASRLMPFRTPKFDGRSLEQGADFSRGVEDYVLRVRDFYDSRARWHRRFYRLSTVLVIMIGALLPLAAGLDYQYKEIALGVSGVAVASLTALRAFYHWDQFWILNRNTEIVITQKYLRWKALSMTASTPPATTPEHAALKLVEEIVKIREDEAGTFFKVLSEHQGT